MTERECKKCLKSKDIDYFEITNKTKNIRRRICKICRVIQRKNYMKEYHKKKYVSKKKQKLETH